MPHPIRIRVSEIAARSAGAGGVRAAPATRHPRQLQGALLASSALLSAGVAHAQSALPQGGRTVAGSAVITSNGTTRTTVTQTSTNAIVNWSSFSVGQGNSVQFVQPGAGSAILNRVTGTATSTIAGQITGNGQVYLVNPNGIAITASGSVDVGGGFVASTLDIADGDFMAGRLAFHGNGTGVASNAGSVTVGKGGFAALLGGNVRNSGTITVPMGKIALDAGEATTLDLTGDGFLQLALPAGGGGGAQAGIRAVMPAAAVVGALRGAVHIADGVAATSAHMEGTALVLGGTTQVAGTLDVSSPTGMGGSVTIGGANIALAGAMINASGGAGGGSVQIGGGSHGATVPGLTTASTVAIDAASAIHADALAAGNGGAVTVWSNQATSFAGTISAQALGARGDGGNAEVSGASLAYSGTTNLLSQHGKTGNLLLDPWNVTIGSSDNNETGFVPTATGASISTTTLQNALATGNVTVTTGASGSETGNITVANAVSWSANTTLTLNAAGGIILNAGITDSGAGSGLTLTAAGAGGISGAGNLAHNGALTFNVSNASANGTLSGVISGAGSVTMAGTGTQTLSGANTYSGATNINSGTLLLVNNAIATSSAMTIASGATLTLNATNNATIGAPTQMGSSFAGGGTIVVEGNGSSDIAWTNTAAMSFSGTVDVTPTGRLGNWLGMTWNSALFRVDGYFAVENYPVSIGGLSGSGTIYQGYDGTTQTLTIGAANQNTTFSGTINGNGSSSTQGNIQYGVLGITKVGTGTLTLSGTNTYSGATTVSAGTLQVLNTSTNANTGTLGTGAVTIASGATLAVTNSRSDGENYFVNNTITGAGAVLLNGPDGGITILQGNNTYSGGTTIASGAVELNYQYDPLGTGTITMTGGALRAYLGTMTLPNNLTLSGTVGFAQTTNLSGTITLAGNTTITPAGNFGNSTWSGPLNLGAYSLTTANTGPNATLNVGLPGSWSAGTSLTISGVVSGTGGITHNAPGSLVLSGANTYTGATTLSAGTLTAGSTSAFGVNSAVTINGGTLNLANYSETIGSLSGSGGVVSATGTDTLTTGTLGANVSYAGTIQNGTGTLSLTKTGTGTLTLTGANTYTGGTTVNSGTVATNATNGLGTGTINIGGAGTLNVYTPSGANTNVANAVTGTGTATLSAIAGVTSVYLNGDWSGFSGTVNAGTGANQSIRLNTTAAGSAAATWNVVGTLSGEASGTYALGALTGSGSLGPNNYSNVIFRVGDANQSTTFSGAIANIVYASVGTTANLTKVGTGTLTLTGANTYTGTTTVSAGTLQIGNGTSGSISSSSATSVASGATLALNEASGSTFTNAVADAGTVNFIQSGTLTASGVISGAGALTQSSAGTTTLSGANTYTGTTTVVAGTLSLTGSLNVGTGTATTVVASGATLSGAGVITAGTLADSGAGTLTLTGNNLVGTLQTSGTLGALTFNDDQSLALGSINAGANAIKVTTTPGSAANLTLNSGAVLTSTAAGAAITLAADANFINNAGAGALSAPNGRWLVYSAAPGTDTFGNLNSGNTAVWNTANGATVSATGNRYAFAFQPTLTVTSTNASKTYGSTANIAANYAVSGFQTAVTGAYLADTAASAYTGTPTLTSAGTLATASVAGGPYAITVSAGSMVAQNGYALNFASSGTLTIAKAPLTLTGATTSTTYNGAAQTNTYAITAGQLYGSDAVTAVAGLASGTNAGIYSDALSGASGTGLANYAISYVGGTLTIARAPLTLTGATTSTTYNGLAQSNSGATLAGLQGADSFTITGYAQGTNAGAYTDALGISANGATLASNYSLNVAAEGTLTIGRAPLTLTYTANAASSTYGAALAAPSGNVAGAGFVAGQTLASLTGTASWATTATPGANAGAYAITGSGLASANYAITANQAPANAAAYTITPAPLTITANNASQTYNASAFAGGNGVTIAGLVNGDTTAALAGTLAYGGTAQGASNAGSYTLTASGLADPNYAIAWVGGTLTIAKAPLTLTGATTSTTYNGAAQTNTYAITAGQLYGSDAVTAVAGLASGTNAGIYSDALSGASGTGLANYAISYVGGTLTIARAPLTLTGATTSTTYNGLAQSNSGATLAGLQGADSFTITGYAQGTNAGAYTDALGISANGATLASNYSLNVAAEGTLTIGRAPLTLTYTANAASSTYGAALAAPSGNVAGAGFVAGQTLASLTGTASWATTATPGANAGAYAITGSGLASANYAITANQAAANASAYTITPAPLTITANNASQTYNASAWAGGNGVTIAGLVNGDTTAALAGTLAYGGTAQGASNAGSYTLTASGLADPNYAIAWVGGTLTIAKAPLTLTGATTSTTYNGAAQTNTYAITAGQLYGSDAVTAVAGLASGTNAGIYSDALSGASGTGLANYAISYVGGTLTIARAPLTLTGATTSTTYNGLAQSNSGATLAGLQGADSFTITGYAQGTNAGAYTDALGISANGATLASNYSLNVAAEGTLTIGRAPLTLTYTANAASSTYGAALAAPSGNVAGAGFVAGQTLASLTGTASWATTATPGANAGAYAITGSGLASANYAITANQAPANAAAYTITPAPLTITANNASQTYNASAFAGGNGVTIAGLVNGDTTAALAGTLAYGGTAQGASNAGSYTLTASGLADPNYAIAWVGGTLTIAKAPLTLTGATTSTTYNGLAQTNTYAITAGQLYGSDAVTAVAGLASGTNAGIYSDALSGASGTGLANYAISYVGGTLTIARAPLTLTGATTSTTYNGLAQSNSGATLAGLQGADSFTITGYAQGTNAGAYTDALGISANGATLASNYSLNVAAEGTLTIGRAPLTLTYTANAASSTYGAALAAPSGNVAGAGFVAGQTLASLTGTASWATTATPGANAGAYAITGSGLASANYAITANQAPANAAAYTITPAPLTITANNASQTYNASAFAGGNGVTIAGLVNGDTTAALAGTLAYGGTAQGASNAGSYTLTASGLADPNYAIAWVGGTLTIAKAPLTLTGATTSTTYNGAAQTNTYAITAGQLYGSDAVTAVAGLASGTNAGIYSDALSGASGTGLANYAISYVGGTLTIARAPLTLTGATTSTTYNGLAQSNSGATLAGLQGADSFTITGYAQGTNAGAYTDALGISANGATLASNYSLNVAAEGTLTIGRAPLTLTYTANAASSTYGAALAAPSGNVAGAGFVAGQTLASLTGTANWATTATPGANAGAYAITGSGLASANYAITANQAPANAAAYTITPAPLTITANNASQTYNASAFAGGNGVTIAGLVNGDTTAALAGTLAYGGTAQGASNAGSYTLTASGLADPNYAIAWVGGTLTIAKAPLTLTGATTSTTYNGLAQSNTYAITAGQLYGSDAVTAVAGLASGTNAGIYSDALSGASGTGLANYAISYVGGTLTIARAPLTLTGATTSTTYNGLAQSNSGATLAGLQGADSFTITGYAQGTNAGAYTDALGISANGATLASNYSLNVAAEGTLTIGRAPLTLTYTANAASSTYGAALAAPSGNVAGAGFVAGQTLASLTGTANWATTATPGANAGAYAITGSGLASANYAITANQAAANASAYTITPAPLTITANNASQTYNASAWAGGNGVTIAGLVNGDTTAALAGTLAYGGTAQGASNAGSYTLTASGLADPNYAIAWVGGTLTIAKAPLTLTGATTSTTYNGLAQTNTYAITAGQLYGSDAVTAVAGLASGTNAGIYSDALSGASGTGLANYAISYVGGTLTIARAPLTLTGATTSTTYNGLAQSNSGATLAGLQGADSFTITGYAQGTNAGAYTDALGISANGATLASNYSLNVAAEGTLTIGRAPLTLTYTANAASSTYGAALAAPSGNVAGAGFVAGQTLASLTGTANWATTATPGANAGAYAITGSGLASANYAITANQAPANAAAYTITPAPLTITANNASQTYNASAFAGGNGVTIAGLVNGDTTAALAGTLAYGGTAQGASNAGSYTLTASGLADPNYAIAWVGGTLTIAKAPLTLTGATTSTTYNGAAQTNTYAITAGQLYGSDAVTAVAGLASGTNAGIYSDALSGASGTGLANYAISYVGGTLTIARAPLTLTGATTSTTYNGLAQSNSGATLAGLQGADSFTITGYAQGTNAGAYTDALGISANGATLASNYSLNVAAEGTLTIGRAPLTLTYTANAASSTYGAALAAPSGNVAGAGFVAGQTLASLTGTASWATTATPGANAGAYAITGSGLASANYAITANQAPANAAAYTITPAPLTITANNASQTYNASAFAGGNGVTIAGLVNGDTTAALAGTLAYGGTAQGASNAGSYTLTASGLADPNYAIAWVGGTLTIAKAPLTLTGATTSTTYNGLAQSNTYAITAGQLYGSDAVTAVAGLASGTNAGIYSDALSGASGTGLANYAISYVGGTLTIARAPLTLTGATTSTTYNGLAQSNSGATLAGLQGADSFTITGYAQGTNAGAYTDALGISANGATLASNYSLNVAAEGTLTIGRAPLTLTYTANAASSTYGAALAAPSGNVAGAGFVAGQTLASLTGTASWATTATPGANAGAYAITGSGLASANYAITANQAPANAAAYTITPAPLTITANNASQTYNASAFAGGNGVTIAGLVNGDTTAALAGTLAYGGTAQGASNAGSYTLTASGLADPNYAIAWVGGTLTIAKAPLTLTGATTSTTYNGAAQTNTYAITAGQLYGSDAVTAVAGLASGTNAGIYSDALSGASGTGLANYAISYVGGTLTIARAPLTLTGATTSTTYNGLAQSNSGATLAGLQGADSFTITGYAQGTNAGAYTDALGISANGATLASNYSLNVAAEGTLTIGRAPLTLTYTANAASSTYGAALAAPSGNVAGAGFVAGQTLASLTGTANWATTATPGANAGAYAITGSGLASANYAITANQAAANASAYTITPAPLTITANNASQTYNASAWAGGNGVTIAGLVNGDTTAALAGTLAYGGTAQGASNAGSYTLTASGLADPNYAIAWVGGTLTIAKAPLTLTGATTSTTYNGLAQSNSGATLAGLQGADSFTITGYAQGTNAGAYTDALGISANGATLASNYSLNVAAEGTLTIGRAPLTLTYTANAASSTYGAALAAPSGNVAGAGFVAGQTLASLTGTASWATTATPGANAGAYAITGSGLASANYAITANQAAANASAYTITPAPLTITANNASQTYNASAWAGGNGVTIAGLVNGDTTAALAGTLAYGGTAQGASNAGSYTLTASGLADPNYAIAWVGGTLTIAKAPLTLTGATTSTTYNGAAQTNTYAITAGQLYGSDAVTAVAGLASGTNAGIYSDALSGASGTGLANYAISYVGGTLTIARAPLTLTGATTSTTYNGLAQSNSGATLAGLQGADSFTITGYAQGTNAGAYTDALGISANGATLASNYSLNVAAEGTLTIGRAPLTLTYTANAASSTYGAALAAPSGNVAGAGFVAGQTLASLTGTASWATTATPGANAGAYAITGSGLASANYAITANQAPANAAAYTITPAPLTITANNASQTYNASAFAGGNGVTIAGLVNGDTTAALAGTLAYGGTAQGASNAGSYTLTASGLADPNYAIAWVGGTLTIAKAPLTLTGATTSTTYNGLAQTNTYAITAGQLYGSDAVTAVAGLASGTNAGIYSDALSGASGTGLANYAISYVGGTLTIARAPLTLTGATTSTTYNGLAQSNSGATLAGLQGADSFTITGYAQGTNAGAYTDALGISANGATLASNYSLNVAAEGTLTIGRAPLTLTYTANAASSTYGAALAAPSGNVAGAGFVAGQTLASLTGTANWATTATPGANAGAYAITGSGLASANYAITANQAPANAAAYTITPAPLTITANNASQTYNASAFAGGNGVTIAGLVNGDTTAALAGTLAYGGTAQGASNAGSYTLTASGLADPNYAIAWVGGTLTIARAPLTLTQQWPSMHLPDLSIIPPLTGTMRIDLTSGQTYGADTNACGGILAGSHSQQPSRCCAPSPQAGHALRPGSPGELATCLATSRHRPPTAEHEHAVELQHLRTASTETGR